MRLLESYCRPRGSLATRLALVLLAVVVLELILVGQQVESVKGLKKKIYMKKLKKVIPLLALFKPKKKVLLIPIPIPMFNKGNSNQMDSFSHDTHMDTNSFGHGSNMDMSMDMPTNQMNQY